MKNSIPLAALVPKNRTPKQCRAKLRREGVTHKGGRWEFSPKKAERVQSLLKAS